MWVGGQLSWLEKVCLASFAEMGYQVKLYSYDELQVPQGVALADASQIIPADRIFQNPPPSESYAGFSNVFRYDLLAAEPDEVWIDTDVLAGARCLPDSDFLLGYEDRHFVNGAVLRIPPNSPILRALQDEAARVDKSSFKWGDLGPRLITKHVKEFDLWSRVSNRDVFYPISSLQVWRLFSPKHRKHVEETIKESSTVHVWNEAFKLSNSDIKKFVPHPDSYLGVKALELGISLTPDRTLPQRTLRDWTRRSQIQMVRNAIGRRILS